jgi:tripartite-type tricarboxylate transporter receptor subunit TctC
MQDLLAGRLDFICDIAVTAVPNIRSGTVKGIANLSASRSPLLPQLPTMVEKGYPGISASTWAGLFLPKNTPAELAAKLNAAVVSTMNAPGLAGQLNDLAATPVAAENQGVSILQLATRIPVRHAAFIQQLLIRGLLRRR